MRCKEFFDANQSGKKCKLLQEMPENQLVEWELETASEYSPGPVASTETLYHQILNPTNLIEGTFTLSPKSFDTASGIGMSTNRIQFASLQRLIELGRARAQSHNDKFPDNPQPRSMWGFVKIPVETVRAQIWPDTGTRGLFVFDTALPYDVSHADICQCVKDTKKVRAIRLVLYDIFKDSAFQIDELPEEVG